MALPSGCPPAGTPADRQNRGRQKCGAFPLGTAVAVIVGMRFTIAKQPYGTNPWYAVLAGTEVHPINAAWFFVGPTSIETSLGTVASDGAVRFFARKRDLVAAIKKESR